MLPPSKTPGSKHWDQLSKRPFLLILPMTFVSQTLYLSKSVLKPSSSWNDRSFRPTLTHFLLEMRYRHQRQVHGQKEAGEEGREYERLEARE